MAEANPTEWPAFQSYPATKDKKVPENLDQLTVTERWLRSQFYSNLDNVYSKPQTVE